MPPRKPASKSSTPSPRKPPNHDPHPVATVPMMQLERIVLITGVTRGLGRAMAEEFARLGHTVLGCGRAQKEIERLAARFGQPHDFSVVDVASDEAVKSWAHRLRESHGAPELLLNNAGVINQNARLWEVSAREFSFVVDVNVKGVANVIRRFVPAMVERQR